MRGSQPPRLALSRARKQPLEGGKLRQVTSLCAFRVEGKEEGRIRSGLIMWLGSGPGLELS